MYDGQMNRVDGDYGRLRDTEYGLHFGLWVPWAVPVAVLCGTLKGCFGVPKTAGRAQPKLAVRTPTRALVL